MALNFNATKNPIFLNELIDYTSESFEFRTRVKAFNTLEEINEKTPAYYKNMVNAMSSANSRLSNPAFNSLKSTLFSKKEILLLEKEMDNTNYLTWQKSQLQNYLKALKTALKFED